MEREYVDKCAHKGGTRKYKYLKKEMKTFFLQFVKQTSTENDRKYSHKH